MAAKAAKKGIRAPEVRENDKQKAMELAVSSME